MRKLCEVIIFLTSLFHHHPAHAQIATLTGNVNNINTVGQAGGIRVMQVIYELHSLSAGGVDQLGCGPGILPRVTGSGVALAATQWPYTPSGTGAMSGSIYRSDFIDCAGVTPTFYKVYMVYAGSKSLFGTFKIDSTTVVSGNFNFTTATGLTGASFTTAVGSTVGAVLLNPVGDQTITVGSLFMPNSKVLGWSDAAFSRESAGVIDCGNGAASNKSCWIQASRFISFNGDFTAATTSTATSGANFASGSFILSASSWNGSAAQNDNWTLQGGENAGTNPTAFLSLGGPSRSQTWQLVLSTSVSATSGLNVNGPDLMLRGNYWNGSVGAIDDWHVTPALGSGANPASTLAFSHAGTSGAAVVQMPTLSLSNGGHVASLTADVDTSGHDSASFGTGKVMIDGTNGDITVKNPLNGFTIFNGANPIFQIDSNGIIRNVEGQFTTGFGVPLSINTGSANSQSGSSVFTQSMSAFPHVGDYRVTITPRMVTLGTGGTLTFSLSYTSDLGAVSCNFNGASMAMSTNTPVNSAVCYIHASSITAPVLTITPSGATGTPFWSAGWYFEELNNF